MHKASVLAAAAAFSAGAQGVAQAAPNYGDIQTVVVIYAENRSFDNLYGQYPGANGLSKATPTSTTQLDRNGQVLSGLPPVVGGTASGVTAGAPTAQTSLTQAQTSTYLSQFNHPFAVGSLYQSVASGDTNPLQYTNRDLYHRFYENQMQINGGANNMFAAWADSGGLTMGYFTRQAADLPLWAVAQKNVLADNFFQSAFGGSYMNHQYLICSCTPIYPAQSVAGTQQPYNPATQATTVYNTAGNAAGSTSTAPAPSVVTYVNGVWTLTTSASSPASALNGAPSFINSSVITPYTAQNGVSAFWSINTSQPPYPPSSNAINTSGAQSEINLASTSTVPPQNQTTIGDLLTNAGVNWAYYSGAFTFAQNNPPSSVETTDNIAADPNFQYHHQPFNYYDRFDPNRPAGMAVARDANGYPKYSGTYAKNGGNTWQYTANSAAIYANSGAAERAQHLLDAGVSTRAVVNAGTMVASQLKTDIDNGTLPPVTFYKPHGTVNSHAGYANVTDGDKHIAAVIAELQASPQWNHMLIVVTYDEFGGWWDHVAPPKGDFFGPGTRIPALIISPYAKKGTVDHTQYDTTSILRFITNKYSLPTLSGITLRDTSLVANGYPAMGDLTGALTLP